MNIVEQYPPDWADFDAAAKRPIEQHVRNSFIKTYKPVLDDAEYRSFDTMEEYRQWCKDNLPDWLGYNRSLNSRTRRSLASVCGAGSQPAAAS